MKKIQGAESKDFSSAPDVIRKPHEYSFTLLEVIIAVGLLVVVVMQVASGQGTLLDIVDYSKKATEATWLAKRLMSQVEYAYSQYDLGELDTSTGSLAIKDAVFKEYNNPDFDFKYSIDIQEWKLPLIDFLTGGGGKSEEEKEEDKDNGKAESSVAGIPGLDGMVKQIFGDHMMKVARVEVSWADGVRRESVGLTYLLTNQKKLDDYVLTKTAIWDGVRKKMDPNAPADKALPGAGNGTGTGGAPNLGPDGKPLPNQPNRGGGTNTNNPNPTPTPEVVVP